MTKQKKEPGIDLKKYNAERVFTKGLMNMTDSIGGGEAIIIESELYYNALVTNNLKPDLYTGIVRDGSYKDRLLYNSAGNIRTESFEVDVEPIKVTYSVFIRDFIGTKNIFVRCATTDLQLAKDMPCQEVDR